MPSSSIAIANQISVLVVDDSSVFRRVLKEIFEKNKKIKIVGEATNGIEALELLLKVDPDVIIMDMEMPLMDGMTALQHLMIHKPIPTIIFSSLTKEGTVRSFDTLKYGAVDFVCKDFIFQGNEMSDYDTIVIQKVIRASRVSVKSVEPLFSPNHQSTSPPPQDKLAVMFCEDCGNQVQFDASSAEKYVTCPGCGDVIEVNVIENYKRNNFITIIGAGEGGYVNLLNIIPQFSSEMSGALVILLYAEYEHVDTFTEYLDSITSMKVQRIKDGISIEGGNCYVASGEEYLFLKPYSAHYTIRSTRKQIPGHKPLDMAMNSIATIFKNKVAGVLLSGSEIDGEIGVKAIKKNGGKVLALNPNDCFCKGMCENIIKKCTIDMIVTESEITKEVQMLHNSAGSSATSTA